MHRNTASEGKKGTQNLQPSTVIKKMSLLGFHTKIEVKGRKQWDWTKHLPFLGPETWCEGQANVPFLQNCSEVSWH